MLDLHRLAEVGELSGTRCCQYGGSNLPPPGIGYFDLGGRQLVLLSPALLVLLPSGCFLGQPVNEGQEPSGGVIPFPKVDPVEAQEVGLD